MCCVYQREITSPSPALAELTELTALSASKNASLDQRYRWEKKEAKSPMHWKSLWRAHVLQLSMRLALLVPLEGCIDRHVCAR